MSPVQAQDLSLIAGGHRLDARLLGAVVPGRPTLVFLHGGLDCIAMWRGLPEAVVAASCLAALIYERWGHGGSDRLILPKRPDHRLNEAGPTLADVFAGAGIDRAILVGHSYGGCLALLGAALHPRVVCGAVAIAPQLVMHEAAREGLRRAIAAWESGKLRDSLAKYHGGNTEALFEGWIAETEDAAMEARYEALLGDITRPVRVLVGAEDEYGYQPNLDMIERAVDPQWRAIEVVAGWRHHPHWHDLAGVAARVAAAIADIRASRGDD